VDRGARLSASYPYSAADAQRWVAEPDKRGQGSEASAGSAIPVRSGFQRDRARVLHSYAFRRLADKTQVVSPGAGAVDADFPRTRLTHSLEVAQIARELGAALGCDPDITDTAGLAHDLGHPPFGHNGEDALDSVAGDCGGFEGNAQTLRILTRLEAKVLGPDGGSVGLNLTRASLDAVGKYPWARRPDTVKFGVYEADRPAFDWVREGQVAGRRCLEAQVMDWADDVAYSVHDVEDGVHSHHIALGVLDDAERQALCETAAASYSARSAAELAPVLDRLLELPALLDLATYDGSYRAQVASKRATSELTGRFTGAAVTATLDANGRRSTPGGPSATRRAVEPLGRYAADLIVPSDIVAECALLKALALRYVMRRPGVQEAQAEQRRVLTELVAALSERGAAGLSPVLAEQWHLAADDAGRLRVVIDQVAQLTDSAARSWHTRLTANA
jgi:dGTPase